jgi:hypothetical protein
MTVVGEIRVIWAIEDANQRVTSLTKFLDTRERIKWKGAGKSKGMNLSTYWVPIQGWQWYFAPSRKHITHNKSRKNVKEIKRILERYSEYSSSYWLIKVSMLQIDQREDGPLRNRKGKQCNNQNIKLAQKLI